MENFWIGFEKRAEEYSDEDVARMLAGISAQPKKKHVLLKGLGGATLGALIGGGLTGLPEGASYGLLLGGGIGSRGRHDNRKREAARDILAMPDGPEKAKKIKDASPNRFWSPFSKRDLTEGRKRQMFGND